MKRTLLRFTLSFFPDIYTYRVNRISVSMHRKCLYAFYSRQSMGYIPHKVKQMNSRTLLVLSILFFLCSFNSISNAGIYMKKKNLPLTSIGLPVFNGQNYIHEAIESVLNQTYSNLELIISDNASTDDTEKICKYYAQKDKRIQYHRFDRNYGASRNYNRTFELSNGPYFKWLAHDDLLTSNNLEKAVAVMENHPDVVLCGSNKKVINSKGETIDHHNLDWLHLCKDKPEERFRDLLRLFSRSFQHADFIFGLIRSENLKRTRLIGNYTSSDFTLLADLILQGKFHVIGEPLFIRRFHQGISTSVYNDNPRYNTPSNTSLKIQHKTHAQIAKWYDPQGKVRYIPHFKWLNEIFGSIKKHPLNGRSKLMLYANSYAWFFRRFSTSLENHLHNLIHKKT